jgi:uncharacterized alpha-E superfamily protein
MLLARVAEDLYWAARYLERAEDTARIVLEHTNLLVDLPTSVPLTWEPLLAIVGTDEDFAARYARADEASIIEFLVAAEDHPASLVGCVAQAREDLRVTRQVLPREVWEAVNDLHLYVASHHAEGVSRPSRNRFLNRVIAECHRTVGILVGTMSRDDAYEFLRLGRNLERADMTTRVLDVRAAQLLGALDGRSAHDDVQWASVLRSLSAQQMFHRTVRRPVDGPSTVRFLLTDAAFPRSVAHCLAEMTHSLEAIAVHTARTVESDGREPEGLTALVASARARLRIEAAAAVDGPALREVVDRIQIALAALHDAIAARHFGLPPGELASGPPAELTVADPDDDARPVIAMPTKPAGPGQGPGPAGGPGQTQRQGQAGAAAVEPTGA